LGEGRGRGHKSLLGGLSRSPNIYASEKEDGDVEAKDIRGSKSKDREGSGRKDGDVEAKDNNGSENEDVEGSGISKKDGGIEAKGSGFYSASSDVLSISYRRYSDP
jgi:hypothetical protein